MNFIGDKRYLSNKISVDIYTFLSCNLFQQFLLKEDADNEFFRHASIHLHVPEVGCCVLDFSQPLHGGGGGRKGGGGGSTLIILYCCCCFIFSRRNS